MSFFIKMYLAAAWGLCLWEAAAAQTPPVNRSVLRLEDIMQGEDYTGYSPREPLWSERGDRLYFEWRTPSDTVYRWYEYALGAKPGTAPLPVDSPELRLPVLGIYDKGRTVKVYEKAGDIYWHDLKKGQTLRLTQTAAHEYAPVFSGDEKKVLFRNGDNLFAWERASGRLEQWTDFQRGAAPAVAAAGTAYEQYLKREEAALFPHLNEKKTKSESDKKDLPKTIYLQENQLNGLVVSPDERYIVFSVSRYNAAPATEYPRFISENGYTRSEKARAKSGSSQLLHSQVGIYDRSRDTVYYVQADQIPGVFDKPAFLSEYARAAGKDFDSLYAQPRELTYQLPPFSSKGYCAVNVRALDNKDRWIMLLEPASGKLSLIDRQHDEAWIGGPGIENWDEAMGTLGWLDDGETLYFQSEQSGYSHLYTHHIPTGKRRALTQGNWEVHRAWPSRDGSRFWLLTSQEHPGERHLYSIKTDGSALQRLTPGEGQYRPTLSPDERHIAFLYSTPNRPWELGLMPNQPKAAVQMLTDSRSAAFKTYPWRSPQVLTFPASDGAQVPARLYLPDSGKGNGAAVIFVHGAGYLQNAHKGWSTYFREYMFHNLLVDNGYAVLDMDFRASAGYGRDWRTGIYRHMGGKDLSDQLDGAAWLVRQHGIDSMRIGIYGGSYGGFITLMAMFTAPGKFRCGAALRSVTDWAHYNQPYTRDILNLPQEDSIAYRRSSPIYHAQGLQGRLLMLHGILDDNVQFQDIIRLSQRLIDLQKDDWELAVYPVERHGFARSTSWIDEYKRIYKLFYECLENAPKEATKPIKN